MPIPSRTDNCRLTILVLVSYFLSSPTWNRRQNTTDWRLCCQAPTKTWFKRSRRLRDSSSISARMMGWRHSPEHRAMMSTGGCLKYLVNSEPLSPMGIAESCGAMSPMGSHRLRSVRRCGLVLQSMRDRHRIQSSGIGSSIPRQVALISRVLNSSSLSATA